MNLFTISYVAVLVRLVLKTGHSNLLTKKSGRILKLDIFNTFYWIVEVDKSIFFRLNVKKINYSISGKVLVPGHPGRMLEHHIKIVF